MDGWWLLVYGVIKITAYAAVCYLGLRWVAGRDTSVVPGALALGLLRAGMGLGFGVAIFFAGAMLLAATDGGFDAQLLTYLSVYVPIRWIEWSLIALLITRSARRPRAFLLGASPRDRVWRLCGIAVSCLADVPVLIAVGGLPLGRFMC